MMNLKQKLAISLCAFYVLSVMGIALSLHFCGGKLADISAVNAKVACKYCKSEPLAQKDDSCCKNTKVDLKVKDSHHVESVVKVPKVFSIDLIFHEIIRDFAGNFLPALFSKLENKAPPRTGVALHVMNCVFRN
jgi:hypothetical protein